MSKHVIKESGQYLLWAKAASGPEIGILIDGADVGLHGSSHVGHESRCDVSGERELTEGTEVSTVPEDAQLIIRRLDDPEPVYDSSTDPV